MRTASFRLAASILALTLAGCAADRGSRPTSPLASDAPELAKSSGVRLVTHEASPSDEEVAADTDTSVLTDADQDSGLVQPATIAAPPRRLPPVGGGVATTVDLASVLAAVDGRHPVVGIARWRTQQALAELDAARVLWLPTLQIGASYHRFDGNLQASNGAILDVNRSSLQGGFGAGAVGAGQTNQPGLVAQFHLADALHQPEIVARRASARGHAATAALNDQLLAAGLAHQRLLAAQQRLAISEENAARLRALAKLTADFADAGEGLQADADRLATELQLGVATLREGEEQLAAASARLAEAISARPGTQFACAEPVIVPIDLIDGNSALRGLVGLGLRNRPELKESQCLVAEACAQLDRERSAPLLPSVLLGMTYGGFGGGLGDTVDQFNERAELNALAVWQVRNLGFGERAARRQREAVVQQTRFDRVRVMDRIAREVQESQGQVVARAARVEATEAAIQTASDSYDRNLDRIRQGEGLPIEALQSAQALDAARRAYLTAVLDYNESQLQLYRALGWPVRL